MFKSRRITLRGDVHEMELVDNRVILIDGNKVLACHQDDLGEIIEWLQDIQEELTHVRT